jgi:hypothetical protein
MFKRIGVWIVVYLVLAAHVISAQDEAPESFLVEQRCIDAPTQPPDGWTYPGMILMSGYAGIHAMQADWETPRVVAQFSLDERGNTAIHGGQLSPDENWYALPMGEVFRSPSNSEFWIVRALKVFNLGGDAQDIWLDLSDYDDALNDGTNSIFAPLVWHDNQELTIGTLSIRPFQNEISDAPFHTMSPIFEPKVFSPDVSLLYGRYDTSFDIGVFNLADMAVVKPLSGVAQVSWRRDSAGFMARIEPKDDNWTGLAYFDRDGELIDYILPFNFLAFSSDEALPASGRRELAWSPDDRYYGYVIDAYPNPHQLMLVDLQERVVIDTCLSALNAPVWSPDGTLFAYLVPARQDLNLIVVDTSVWKSYVVGRHNSTVRLWGDPQMVGWRDTPEAQ